MGVWKPVAGEFCRKRGYTNLQRMILMKNLRALERVENVEYLDYRATTAYNESDGLEVFRQILMLRKLHEEESIRRIDLQGLTTAMMHDNSLVIINASDYVHDSQALRDVMTSFRQVCPNEPTNFVTIARVAARAKTTLTKLSRTVSELPNISMFDRQA